MGWDMGAARPGAGIALLLCTACSDGGGNAPYPPADPVAPPDVGVAVSVGHVCAWKRGGHAYCWGHNGAGQLGNGTETASALPVRIALDEPIADMSVGAWSLNGHSCAVTTTGDVYCWGLNDAGQAGLETHYYRGLSPRRVALPAAATSVALGGRHSCALLVTGEVYCWGQGRDSALGTGSTSDSPEPGRVLDVSDAVAISSGGIHACAVLADGRARCWGNASTGGLGYGDFIQLHHGSYEVVTGIGANQRPLSDIVQLGAAADRSCAWVSSGDILCWGDRSMPSAERTDWARAMIGRVRQIGGACGLTTSGRAWCENSHPGSSGLGAEVEGAAWVEGTGALACIVTDDDQVHCLGRNDHGQLGDGTFEDRDTPAPVLGLEW